MLSINSRRWSRIAACKCLEIVLVQGLGGRESVCDGRPGLDRVNYSVDSTVVVILTRRPVRTTVVS